MEIVCKQCERPFEPVRRAGSRGPAPSVCSEECRRARAKDRYQSVMEQKGWAEEKAARAAGKLIVPATPLAPPQAAADAPDDARRSRVEAMAGMGLEAPEIALVERMPVERVRAEYATELARGPVVANVAIAQNLYRLAQGTGTAAVTASWKWLQARAGWTEFAPPRTNVGEPAPEPLGKKAQQNLEALAAEKGTSWADLIRH